MLPKLDPAWFIWYRVGGDLELHLMLLDETAAGPAALLPRRRRPGRAAGAARGGRRRDARRHRARRPAALHVPRPVRQPDRARPDRRMTEALVGLDVGTSAVKAVAISPDGEVLGLAEEAYPLSTPQPGLGRAGSRGLVARGAGGAGAGPGGADRALRADARPRRARRGASEVIRPAILWNDGRTGAECAEIEAAARARAPDRADRQPRARRVHRAEAPLAARATSPRPTRGSGASCCRRTTSTSG